MMTSDEILVQAAQAGSMPAFNQLVLTYSGLIHNVAYHILGDGDAAADATQDTFLKAYRSLGRFHSGSFRAWLLTIVTNTCYDGLRSRRRHATRSIEQMEASGEYVDWLVDHRERPAEHAERRELAAAIQRGLRVLPPDQRTVLVLSDIEGLSYSEIAAVTGTNMGTVKSRLSRGRARLRDYLLGLEDLLPRDLRSAANAAQLEMI